MASPIVDAHLDLAWNAHNGRDLTLSAAEVRAAEQKTEAQCMVSLPELRRGGVALVFGSIFVLPKHSYQDVDPVFDEETHAEGLRQADLYRRWEDEGLVRIVRDRRSLAAHLSAWAEDGVPGVLVTIEGAEPIRDPDELSHWFALGVRLIGPAWGFTRYCGGFAGSWGRPGGYTSMGRELVAGMGELGILLDLAHGSVEGFLEGLELAPGRVATTHTSPREVEGVERFPDAAMLRALADVGGVAGLGLGGVFLYPDWTVERQVLSTSRFGEVLELMAGAAGWEHVGIGSDLDGGFGLEESPVELETIADIGHLSEVLPADAVEGALGGNWIRLLERVLPPG